MKAESFFSYFQKKLLNILKYLNINLFVSNPQFYKIVNKFTFVRIQICMIGKKLHQKALFKIL